MANEILPRNEIPDLIGETDESGAALGAMIREIMSPVLEAMAKFMQQSTEALERLGAEQKAQSDRMEALERQIRLNTPVTPTQVRYFNDAIRRRARELLMKPGFDEDGKAVKALSASIRKSVITRYGAAALHEIPRHEYSVVMQQIATWNDMLFVRDVIKEARKRNDSDVALANAEPPARSDG